MGPERIATLPTVTDVEVMPVVDASSAGVTLETAMHGARCGGPDGTAAPAGAEKARVDAQHRRGSGHAQQGYSHSPAGASPRR